MELMAPRKLLQVTVSYTVRGIMDVFGPEEERIFRLPEKPSVLLRNWE
jgi:hypothetical protein